MVAQFTQLDKDYDKNVAVSGGLNLRGGTTVIAAANGDIRYVIAKPLEFISKTGKRDEEGRKRRERQEAFVRKQDKMDTNLTWKGSSYFNNRAKSLNFKTIHGAIGR